MILTLVLTIVLAVVVIALATYATAGLATSEITTERNESNAVTSAGLSWYIEELQSKRIEPSDPTACDDGVTLPTPAPVIVPVGALPANGLSVEIGCESIGEIGFHPAVRLTALGTTLQGTTRSIEVVAQVPRSQYTVQIYTWTAD